VFNASPSSPLTIVPISQVAQVTTSGLVSYWKFDEGSGNSVSSSVGGASDTLGTPSWIAGKVNGALSFNGSDYVNAGDISLPSFTISAWIRPTANSNFGSIVMKQNVYGLESQGTAVYARLGNGSGWTGGNSSNLSGTITLGTWQLVTQTYNASTGEHRLYINKTARTAKNAVAPTLTGSPLLIGSWDTSFAEPFMGGIDEVRVYNRALSASEVGQLVDATVVTAPVDTTAPSISAVTVAAPQQTEGRITWTTNEASDTQVEFGLTTSYSGNSALKDTGSSMVTSHAQTIIGLAENTIYNYRVLSRDAAGNLATSGNYTFKTAVASDVTAPTVPTSVTATNVTQTALTLSWGASVDNVAITGYRVFRNGTQIGTVTGTSFNDSGLTKATSYTYTVDAYDAAGNRSALTSGRVVTTLANVAPSVTVSTITVSGAAPAAAIYIPVTATDPDGTITSVAFYNGSTLIGTDDFFPYVYTWNNVAVGAYNITARATDNDGAVSTSNIVTVTVSPPPTSTTLLRYWTLDQTSGTTAADVSGNSGSATLVGGPTWTTGVVGNGLDFNGTSAYLNAGNIGPAKFSLSAWVNVSTTATSDWHAIVIKQNSYGFEMSNGRVYASVGNGSAWTNTVQATIPSGVWKHIVQTYDGTTNRLYIDGALVASGAGAFTNSSANLLIGSWNGSSEYFKGKIDEVRVYNGALTATEVSLLFNSVTPSNPTSYTVSVTKSGTGTGTVTSTGSINCGTTCSSTGNAGQAVTLTATPAAGSTFAGWSGACTGTATTCSFTLNANTAVNAIFNTTDTSAPTIPANLTATAVSSSQINLSWTASSDNVGVAGYQVFRAGVQIANITPAATTFQNTTGLLPSTSYTYTVRAYDAVGNLSAPSTAASATTQVGATYTLTTTAAGTGGTISRSPNATTYAAGTVVTLTATPTTSGHTVSWTGCGSTVSGSTCVITVNANTTVTATFAAVVTGTTYYVRPGATGNGSDWTNALGALPATLVRGATYYLATGSYGYYNLNTPVSGTQLITIKKASPTVHGTETGWNSAYGVGQAVFPRIQIFDSAYITFDGSYEYGIKIAFGHGGVGLELAIQVLSQMPNITFKYMEVAGPAGTAPYPYTLTTRAMYAGFFSGKTLPNLTISHSDFHGSETLIQIAGAPNMLIEYTKLHDVVLQPAGVDIHPNTTYLQNSPDSVFRNNEIYNWDTMGLYFVYSGNWKAYNNVFHDAVYIANNVKNPQAVTAQGNAEGGGPYSGTITLYNNTVVGPVAESISFKSALSAGSTGYNNLFYNNGVTPTWGTAAQSNNLVTTVDQFTNLTNKDYTLSSASTAINAGIALASEYATDRNGVTRPQGAGWDIGAYEFTGIVTPVTYTVSVTKSGTGVGTVTSTGSINCGTTCTSVGNADQTVNLTATPASGSTFAGWSGATGCTTAAACSFTLNANTIVNAVFNTTVDTSGPTTPSALTATAVSSSQINLSWTASTDNVGVAGYRIMRGGTQVALVTSGTTYQDTGLTASTAYSYTVIAYDAAGNSSAASTAASATTQGVVGTTVYIRSGATGNGADWTNALAALPATLTRGSTYYIADGSYPGYTVDDAGTTVITIKKATVADHGTNTGWVSTYGDGQAIFSGTLAFSTSNVLVDGQTGGGLGNWTGLSAPFGFKVNAGIGQEGILVTSGTGVTVRHIEVEGDHGDIDGAFPNNDAVSFRSGPSSGFTLSYAYLHDMGRTIFFSNVAATGVVIENTYTGMMESTAGEHAETASIWGGSSNWTFRNNLFAYAEGTGGLMFEGNDFKVYGNVFYQLPGQTWEAGNGVIGSWTVSTVTNLKVYNNTFVNIRNGVVFGALFTAPVTGNVASNNLFYGVSTGIKSSIATFDNNHYITSSITGTGETGATTGTTDPFVDYVNLDFRLKAATPSGASLASPYNVDALGNTRGTGGTWDKGAYEYTGTVSAGCTQTLSTGANIASAVSSAAADSTICLNSGNYSAVNFTDIARTSMVTVKSVSGVSAQMSPVFSNSDYIRLESMTLSNAAISRCSTNIQLVNNTWVQDTGGISVNDNAQGCDSSNKNILIDGNTMIMTRATGGEGKITITSVNGVTIKNNLIQGEPGAALPSGSKTGGDGIQMAGSVNNIIIGPGNILRDLLQAPCGSDPLNDPHCDSIQIVDSAPNANIVVSGNWFDNVEVTLQHHDWGTSALKFNNNLITNSRHNWSYNAPTSGAVIEHNTFYTQGDANWGKYGGVDSANLSFKNNILVNSASPYWCGAASCTANNNLGTTAGQAIGTNSIIGTPTFVGGTVPTTWAGWQLAVGSLGKGTASDGLDRGTTYFGSGTIVTPPVSTDTSGPTTPTSLTASAVSSSQINLSWTASTDNVGVAGYRIMRAGTQIALVTSGTTYQNTGLTASTAYSYTVIAYDAAGNSSAASTAASATTQVATPVTTVVSRYWNLNESSGTSAADSSGNGGTATLVGSPTWTTGVAGNGLTLNGTSQYLNAGNVGSAAFTLSAWVNATPDSSGAWHSVVIKQNSFGFEMNNGVVYASVGDGSSWSGTVQAPIASGVWKHIVQTYDGTNNRIYVDGVLVASGTGSLTNTSSNLLIGSWNGSSEFFNGKIDEVRVYNGALTSAEVSTLYNSVTQVIVTPPTTSTKFSAGQQIQVSGTGTFLNIRSSALASASVVGTAVDGTTGTVVANAANGISAGGYYWWYVTLNGVTGWAVENYLTSYTAPQSGTTINVTPSTWSSTTFVRGNTYVLSSGTYAGRTLSTPESGTQAITIKGTGSGQVVFSSGINITSSYWNIDGVTGSMSSDPNAYGFRFADGLTNGFFIGDSSYRTFSDITISHVAAKAPTTDVEKIFLEVGTQVTAVNRLTLNHSLLNGYQGGVNIHGSADGWIFERNVALNGASTDAHHGEWFNSSGNTTNAIVRYNLFKGNSGSMTGIIVANNGPLNGVEVYGNIFDTVMVGNGIVAGTTAYPLNNAKIYNNTVLNSSLLGDWVGFGGSGNIVKNNLIYNTRASVSAGVAASYNAYFSATNVPTEATGQIGTGNPFVNSAAGNYSLISATNAGDTTIAAQYRTDMSGLVGTMRGASQTAGTVVTTGSTYYVRSGATGNGSDWTNALGAIPSTLARGTTYYVASGNYGAQIFNPSGTGTATVLKAIDNATCSTLGKTTAQCHGTSTGWSDSYGTGAAQFTGWEIRGGDLVIDGQKGAGSLNLNSIDYGFKVAKNTGYAVCVGAACTGSQTTLSNLTIAHTEIQGGGDDGANCTLHNKGIFMYYGSYSNINIAYNYIHDVGNMNLDLEGMSNGVIEYNYIARNESLNTTACEEHSEGLFGDGSSNSVVRYNAWEDIEGTGVIMMSGSGWKVYGNLIFRTGNPTYSTISNGSIAGWSSKPFSNSFVYNNTVANCLGVCSVDASGTGNAVANNIIMDSASYVSSRFVSPATKNFRLASAYSGATTLASPYNTDMDGKTRGSDGIWDMGAYEFTGTVASSCTGTCKYVTSNGAGDGSSWSSPLNWSTFVPVRGVTYYVAGGSYVEREFSTAPSGSSYITLKKATTADHGTETGWASSYGTTQASITGTVDFNSSYWVFDGSARNESDWFDATSYGFKISGAQQQIYVGKNSSYIQIKNMVLEQPTTLETAAVRRYSLDLYSFGGYPGTQQGIVVARSYFKNGNVPIFASRTTGEYIDGMLVEYNAFDNTKSNVNNHGEAISCYYNGCGKNFVIRFNKFRGVAGTAIIAMTGADNFQFYGNVIWNSDLGDGLLGFSEAASSNFTNAKVFNNTIVDKVSGYNEGIAFQTGSNNLVYNNLWLNTPGTSHGAATTRAYNAYDGTTSYSGSASEANVQTSITSALFTDYSTDNLTLKSNTTAGMNLSNVSGYVSEWSRDLVGKTRSTWSRGAYEF
jgi:chitodextrinase